MSSNISSQKFLKEFEFAKSAILQASDIVISYFDKNISISYKSDLSILTEADKTTEEFLRKALQEKFPNIGFIGEETDSNIQPISWIVDPIDGTTAFARGLPEFAIVLGLKSDDEMIFSLIYLPVFKDLYFAYKNSGAFKNNERINVSRASDLLASVISVDYKNLRKKVYPHSITNVLETARFRTTHSTAVESAYVASGRIEGLIKFEQHIWDTGPETLLMKEAGARVIDEFGNNLKLLFSKKATHNYIAITSSLDLNLFINPSL